MEPIRGGKFISTEEALRLIMSGKAKFYKPKSKKSSRNYGRPAKR